MGTVFLVVAFVVLLGMRVPIAFTLGLVSLGYIWVFADGVPLTMMPQRMYASTASFVLTAIPFFILVGELMNASRISHRLVAFARSLVGHTRGGMGMVSLLSSVMVAAFSGSAVANAAGTGSITVPAMKRAGYPSGFAAAIESSSSSLGSVVPPSIAMVVYGALTGVSIGGLFIAGYLPTVVYVLGFALVIRHFAGKREVPIDERANLRTVARNGFHALGALMIPVIIMGGILAGIMTPTEAGAAGALYTFLVATLLYRTLRLSDIPQVLLRTAVTTGIVLLIIATAAIFAWILTRERIPALIAETMLGGLTEGWQVMLVLIILLILVGTFMETISALAIVTPIIVGVAAGAGLDPLFVGTIAVLSLAIGVATPPVGVVLFVTSRLASTTIEETSRAVLPFVAIFILGTMLLALVPDVVLFLPRLLLS